MRALLFEGDLRFEAHAPVPTRAAGEALIRVRMAGICGTDLEITRGYKGFTGIPGHEFVGVVEDADDTSWLGQRVCGEINISCDACTYCDAGIPTHCERRAVLGLIGHNGSFADYLVLPQGNLHLVPSSVTDEEATMVEPLAAAFQIGEQVDLASARSVVVLGDGRLGGLCALALRALGCDPLVVGKHDEKLQRLAGCGLRTALLGDESPRDVDLVVEATGSRDGMGLALEWTRPRGTIVLKSTVAGGSSADLSIAVVKELTMVGSRCGPFPRAILALERAEVDVRPLITDCFSLDDGLVAFERAEQADAVKVLLSISEDRI